MVLMKVKDARSLSPEAQEALRLSVGKAGRSGMNQSKAADKVRNFFLPTYSPELNIDELLNQDEKSNAPGRRRPLEEWEVMDHVLGCLRSTQRQTLIVKAYFYGQHVQNSMT